VNRVSDRELPPSGSRTTGILDRITDAFFALDDEWRFTYLNDRAEQMLDASRAELVGQVIWDEFPETIETQFPAGFHLAIETQEPVAFEVYHRPLDTWFEARAYPSESGLTVSLRDVTERKERQRDLSQYQTIVEAVHDGVFTVDENDTVTFANEAVESTFGVAPEDLIGEHVEAVPQSASIDEDGIADIGHAIDQLRRGDTDEYRLEFTYTGPERDMRTGESRMVPIGDGEIAGVVRDVTEHREFERVVTYLHSITPQLLNAEGELEICSIAVHAAGEVLDLRISGIWLLDRERNRLDPVAATAGAHEEIGGLPQFPKGEGVVWRAFREGDPARYDDLRKLDAVSTETPLRSEIVVPIGDHGVLMAGETTPDALSETDLELMTILAASTEAALDRAERNQLLGRSQDALERQNERLDVVESVLAEDLRNQLAVATSRVRRGDTEDAVDSLVRARRLVDDALELAGGGISVGPRAPVEAGEVATTASSIVDGVEVEVADGAWLRADRERLVRLFETLFLDARERARQNEDGNGNEDERERTTVTVELGVADPETLYVADDASPIPEERRDEVFDLDRAPDAAAVVDLEERAGQPGLGLTVAGEIATVHGWEIDVVTVPEPDTLDDETNEADDRVRVEIGAITTLEPAA
jgi:PAS domain S-box-containing protein